MSFDTDLRDAEAFEMLVAKYLSRKQRGLIWPNEYGRNADRDFKLFVPIDVEIKYDRKAADTGNFYFEVYNTRQNKPSGIAATKAHIVYHFVPPNRLFNYEPKFLLGAIERLKVEGTARLVDGGDNNSRGWLVKISDLTASMYVEEEVLSI